MDDSDASALVAAALQHDEEAARALVRRLYPLVAKVVRAHRPRRTEEEDLCQMIFIKVFQKLSQFSGKVPLEHWVSRIAINTCLNQIESEKVRPELRHADLSDEEKAVVEALAVSSDELAPDHRFASRQLVEHLLGALKPVERLHRALKWKLIAGFLLVFLAGGLTGAFVGASHVRHFFFKFHHRGDISERMRHRLQRELDLTPEQVAKISPILDRAAAQLQQVRLDTGQRVREILNETHRQMTPHLTDEQREKLKQIEERHRRWRRHRSSREPAAEPSVLPPQNSPPG